MRKSEGWNAGSRKKLRRVSMKRLVFSCSRSSDPQYSEVHRLADTVRYNSAMNNVAHYPDFPNRCGTPIKLPNPPSSSSTKLYSQPSPQERYIRSLMSSEPLISLETKRAIARMALQSTLRGQTAVLRMKALRGSRPGDVLNDFHVRATNPGFARNELGGFFTR